MQVHHLRSATAAFRSTWRVILHQHASRQHIPTVFQPPTRSLSSIITPDNRRDHTRDTTPPSSAVWDRLLARLSITPQHKQKAIEWQTTLISAKRNFDHVYTRVAATRYGRLMRLDKPIGSRLLFLPAAWGISIAVNSVPDFLLLSTLFYSGAVLLRGAGCTINDIWDVDIDRNVERTRSRPIAAGEISVPMAFGFLATQLSAGLVILTQLNSTAFLVGSLAVIPVFFYPLAKRRIGQPQSVLGLTFNTGALLGYAAAADSLAMPALWLYGAGWCWTMVYDTIYAHQDLRDDRAIGIGSSALQFEGNTRSILALFTAGKLACLTGAGLSAGLSLPYFMGISASCMQLGRLVYDTDLSDSEQCNKAFISNSKIGLMTWLSILAGRLF